MTNKNRNFEKILKDTLKSANAIIIKNIFSNEL